MDFNSLTIEILTGLKNFVGNYGLAIIFLTIIVRVLLWPLNVKQHVSMKKMQALAPELKRLQERYKSKPEELQKKMLEFYKENKFNPFGGCFPLLLQMPIFIMLYTALISPQFIQIAGNSSFLFISRLDNTLQSYAGKPNDGVFNIIDGNEHFSVANKATLTLKDGKSLDVFIHDNMNAIKVYPVNGVNKDQIVPGDPIILSLALDKIDASPVVKNNIQTLNTLTLNMKTKETESVTFHNDPKTGLSATVKTSKGKLKHHVDVLILILLFALSMFISQKLMMSTTSTVGVDEKQRQVQESMSKVMPLMISAMFLFFPVPAGVLLYMIASNLFQMGQSFVLNKQYPSYAAAAAPSSPVGSNIIEVKPEQVRAVSQPDEEDNTSSTKGALGKKKKKRRR